MLAKGGRSDVFDEETSAREEKFSTIGIRAKNCENEVAHVASSRTGKML